jgi:hypothetical protein
MDSNLLRVVRFRLRSLTQGGEGTKACSADKQRSYFTIKVRDGFVARGSAGGEAGGGGGGGARPKPEPYLQDNDEDGGCH